MTEPSAGAGTLRQHSFVVRYLTLFGGEVTSKLCVIAAVAYLARVLPPSEYGLVELALSTTTFFVLAVETGFGNYGARLLGTAPERAAQLVPQSTLLRGLLALPVYGVILVLAIRTGSAGTTMLAIYGLTVLLTPLNTQWVFQGLRQMQWVAVGNLLRYGAFAAVVLLIVRRGSDPRLVAVAEVTGVVLLTVLNTVLIRRTLAVRLDWQDAWAGARQLLRDTWFLGASDVTWAAMWYAPTLILGWTGLGGTERVAWLAASVRIVMALHAFVFLYFFNLIPNLSTELHDGVARWRDLVERSLAISTWASWLVVVGGVLMAPVIIGTVFGRLYADAVLPFQIVVWMIPIAWLSGHFRTSLIVSGHQHMEFAASAAAGVTTIVLALAATRTWGAPGAAVALVSGGLVHALVSGVSVFRLIGPLRLTVMGSAIATGLASMAAGLLAGGAVGRPLASVGACVLYVAVAASQWDMARLRNAWHGRAG